MNNSQNGADHKSSRSEVTCRQSLIGVSTEKNIRVAPNFTSSQKLQSSSFKTRHTHSKTARVTIVDNAVHHSKKRLGSSTSPKEMFTLFDDKPKKVLKVKDNDSIRLLPLVNDQDLLQFAQLMASSIENLVN